MIIIMSLMFKSHYRVDPVLKRGSDISNQSKCTGAVVLVTGPNPMRSIDIIHINSWISNRYLDDDDKMKKSDAAGPVVASLFFRIEGTTSSLFCMSSLLTAQKSVSYLLMVVSLSPFLTCFSSLSFAVVFSTPPSTFVVILSSWSQVMMEFSAAAGAPAGLLLHD